MPLPPARALTRLGPRRKRCYCGWRCFSEGVLSRQGVKDEGLFQLGAGTLRMMSCNASPATSRSRHSASLRDGPERKETSTPNRKIQQPAVAAKARHGTVLNSSISKTLRRALLAVSPQYAVGHETMSSSFTRLLRCRL